MRDIDRAYIDLKVAWHRTFGRVKCGSSWCPVCASTDWPEWRR